MGGQAMNNHDTAAPSPTEASDPLLDELRSIKRQISSEHGDDVRRLAETLRRIEAQHASKVIRTHPVPRRVQAG